MAIQRPRILLIDSYDSFTYNLAALCRQSIPEAQIHIIKNDQLTLSQILPVLNLFSAVIVGPGPGSPEETKDIGVVKHLWKLEQRYSLPVFGVCLGLQSLGVEFGATLRRLSVVKHGQVSRIHHRGSDIFSGVGKVQAVRYHSLCVDIEEDSELETLAWADDEGDNGKVIMGLKHKTRPLWAVQYHPESIRTDGGGLDVVCNFWNLAQNWTRKCNRKLHTCTDEEAAVIGSIWPPKVTILMPLQPSIASTVETRVLHLPDLTVIHACEILGVEKEDSPFVVLDSAAQPGRWSIIGVTNSSSLRINYTIGDQSVRLVQGAMSSHETLDSRDIWAWIKDYMQGKRAEGGTPDVPFWGGLVGYLSYELGVYTLPVHLPKNTDCGTRHEDVNLIFVERSLILDSVTGTVYVQTIQANDGDWLDEMSSRLKDASPASNELYALKRRKTACPGRATALIPNKALYISKVERAKEYLFAGESYELCLTAPTRITVTASPSDSSSSWQRYKNLRKSNPAPHSAYIRLHPTTILSSSPERFLSFSRPPNTTCQLRPIKGTVKKAPEITRAVAEKLLAGSVKEVAENLMIVDLIRHDLHSIVGDNVVVKQFCKVEEYETVWQLVSVIEGRLADKQISDHSLGWDALKHSLPPGSMTGAPKKRSVEILQSLEDTERGIYSGVFGYWCVGGSGDWSVAIRSSFKHQSVVEPVVDPAFDDCVTEEWVVGAGGAITALSDAEAEWEEMLVKLQSVLRAFGVSPTT